MRHCPPPRRLRHLLTLVVAILALGCSSPSLARTPAPLRLPAVHLPPPVAHGRPGTPVPIFDPSTHAMDAFRTAVARAARHKGQARIAFYGASHTAADFWTGTLRRILQERIGDGGHGFVFPARWNVGYRHQDLIIDSSTGWRVERHKQGGPVTDLGLAGLSMASNDRADFASVRTGREGPYGRLANRVTLWYRTDPQGGELTVDIDGQRSTVQTRALEAGLRSRVWKLSDSGHTVRLSPVGSGTVTLFGIALDRSAPGAIVDQLGIPGMRADIVLHWQEDTWKQMLRDREPDLVVLAYGTNDVGDADEPPEVYAATWRQVLTRVRAAAPGASCLIVGPTDRLGKDAAGNRHTMPHTPSVIATQRQVAAELGCGHWDAQAAMGGAGAMIEWQRAGLATTDDVHLRREGYGWIAELMAHALLSPPDPDLTWSKVNRHRRSSP